ncbi:MAG TPA: peptide chain release factor N(5)-glutamine methyltransferase [Gemmatimonadales bacterium]|nr:peptide chain release factor N(5)-glutamine methyltransferase [Gemmatimonadales bacterium]
MPDLALSRREVLAAAAAALSGARVTEPRREALRLWAEIAPGAGEALVLEPDQAVPSSDRRRLQDLVRRRIAGEPFAYVVGRAAFRRLELRADRRALIPRPETEGLVDLLLAKVRTGRAADVGTGTGCLALSLATEGSFDRVTATDVSRDAIGLAAENRREVGAAVDLVLGDLCDPLADASLDALVSNPPYLTSAEYAGLDPAVRDWEPNGALESGADGMAATDRLLAEGRRVLRPAGWIALEVDCTRATMAAARARELGWSEVMVETDLFGRERYLLARRSAAT